MVCLRDAKKRYGTVIDPADNWIADLNWLHLDGQKHTVLHNGDVVRIMQLLGGG